MCEQEVCDDTTKGRTWNIYREIETHNDCSMTERKEKKIVANGMKILKACHMSIRCLCIFLSFLFHVHYLLNVCTDKQNSLYIFFYSFAKWFRITLKVIEREMHGVSINKVKIVFKIRTRFYRNKKLARRKCDFFSFSKDHLPSNKKN